MTAANEKDKRDDGDAPAKAVAPNGDASAKAPKAEAETAAKAEAPAAPDGAGAAAEKDAEEKKDAAPARKPVKVQICGVSDVGQVRPHNEDNFIIADLGENKRGMEGVGEVNIVDRGAVLGVCDGMGGAAAGEVASQLAVDIIFQRMSSGDRPDGRDDFAQRLVAAIESAGLRIFSEAKLDRSRRGMGTTSTIAGLVDDHLFLGQVGDSRGYIYRGERLVQVTRDQSLVTQLIEAGQLTEEEAETFEHNNIILQALGTSETVQVDLTYVELRRGDVLLVCSDGLSGMVRADDIRETLAKEKQLDLACKALIDKANDAGGHDNVTVVLARFDGEGIPPLADGDAEGLKYAKYPLPEPKPSSSQTIPEPNRRPKELDTQKISVRPPSAEQPEIEVREDDAASSARYEDPIHIPTDTAPQWLVVMMIASAVACVTIAGYYLLR